MLQDGEGDPRAKIWPPAERQPACRRVLMSGAEIQWYCGKARPLRLHLPPPPEPPASYHSSPPWPITCLRFLPPQRPHAWMTESGANGAPAEAVGSAVRTVTFSYANSGESPFEFAPVCPLVGYSSLGCLLNAGLSHPFISCYHHYHNEWSTNNFHSDCYFYIISLYNRKRFKCHFPIIFLCKYSSVFNLSTWSCFVIF